MSVLSATEKILLKSTFFLALVGFLLPYLFLFSAWSQAHDDAWQFFMKYEWKSCLQITLFFSFGTVLISTVIGATLAWLFTCFEFPLQRLLQWVLIFPLAIPAYVLGFVYLKVFLPAGILQQTLKSIFENYTYLSISNIYVAILLKSLTLYPYIFLLFRSALLTQGGRFADVGKMIGMGQWRMLWHIYLPMSWPWLLSGMMVVFMESIADYGMCSFLSIDTITVKIYSIWMHQNSLPSAAKLASFLFLLMILFFIFENILLGKKKFNNSSKGGGVMKRVSLPFPFQMFGVFFCLVLSIFSFVLPFLMLGNWCLLGKKEYFAKYMTSFWPDLTNSISLSFLGATICVLIGFYFTVITRFFSQKYKWLVRFSCVGYAMPGTLLSVGVFSLLLLIDDLLLHQVNIRNSILGLIIGYSLRFLVIAVQGTTSSWERISRSLEEAAALQGVGLIGMIWKVVLPLLKTGLLTTYVMVFIDIMKEMPITLCMRPHGWNTLATQVYAYTSEGQWDLASLPALLLIVLGMLPVILLLISQKQESASR